MEVSMRRGEKMRLIDADTLMETINKHCYPVQHDMTSIEPGMTRMGILQAIQEQPTIEPEILACGSGELVQTGSSDLISRQAAIDALSQHFLLDAVKPIIDSVPSAEPERKKGKWIDDNCSECGQYVYHGDARNFCPNCGCQMER